MVYQAWVCEWVTWRAFGVSEIGTVGHVILIAECVVLGQLPDGIHVMFFFFQAEDGIRDWSVTGVQTCALPIFSRHASPRGGFLFHERNAHHSLNSPACSCVSITLPASS